MVSLWELGGGQGAGQEARKPVQGVTAGSILDIPYWLGFWEYQLLLERIPVQLRLVACEGYPVFQLHPSPPRPAGGGGASLPSSDAQFWGAGTPVGWLQTSSFHTSIPPCESRPTPSYRNPVHFYFQSEFR